MFVSGTQQSVSVLHSFIEECIYIYSFIIHFIVVFPSGSSGKESAYNAGGMGLIPGSGRSPGGGNGNPLQYSCLKNLMDRGAWLTSVHGVTKSWTRLSD